MLIDSKSPMGRLAAILAIIFWNYCDCFSVGTSHSRWYIPYHHRGIGSGKKAVSL
jgi:hypothetical protein